MGVGNGQTLKIYRLTNIGYNMSATPSTGFTPGGKILGFLRRHGFVATDAQILDRVFNNDKNSMYRAIRPLIDNEMIIELNPEKKAE
jgi:hypothetical protein